MGALIIRVTLGVSTLVLITAAMFLVRGYPEKAAEISFYALPLIFFALGEFIIRLMGGDC